MYEQLRYAVPLGIAGVAGLVHTDLPMYVVARHFSPAEYAVYAVGCFQLPLIGLLRESVNAVVMPRISYLQQHHENRQIVVLLAGAIRKLSFAYWPVYVFLTVCAYEFITLLYTARYAASVPIFVINVVTVPFMMLLYDAVFRAYADNTGYLLKLRAVETVLVIAGVYAGIRWFGMRGAITAAVIMVLADYIAASWKAARILGMTRHDFPLFADMGKLAVCAMLAGGVTAIARHFIAGAHPVPVLLATGVIFCIAYAAAVYWSGIPTPEESDMVRSKLRQAGRVLKVA
jgi:O-antigen/teichoic acid export membrane protein